jgi:hypothetical protein
MILVAVCVFARSIWADAWTQPAGHGQVIWNSTFTDISHEFDGSGKITLFGDGGKFRKLEINPYFEYGLNASTSLVVNAFLPALNYSNNYRSSSSFGLGDVEAGVRRRLNPTESAFAVSTQFTVLFPTYSADRNPAPGNHQVDVETRLMAGRGFEVRRHHNFLSIGAAYRYRNGPPADQIRTDATWGIDVTGRLMAMAQYSGITGMRNGKPLEALDNPNLQSDFDLYKGQISLVVRITPKTRIQCGWIDAFAGRNTGHGETALVAIWRSF